MSPASAAAHDQHPSVVLAFSEAGEAELAEMKHLSIGIMSATQGRYSAAQLLLDITQGARIAASAYHQAPPPLPLTPLHAGALVRGWAKARARAEDAPQLLSPGLLATQIPGGAAYAGVAGAEDGDGLAAAERNGEIATVSLGSASTLLARVAALRARESLVVCDLPSGRQGYADLRSLSASATPAELLIVVQHAPHTAADELLWVGAGGLAGGGGGELSSQTTNERGLISATDLAPTILRHLHLAIPSQMRGAPAHTDGELHSGSLRALMARLRVIGHRRLRALAVLLCAWALMLLIAALPRGRGRAGAGARARAMRVGALAILWAPVAVLLPAALEPSAALEYTLITLVCLALGALTDALLPWPRAPIAPAAVGFVALVADALAGTQLLMRSLLGPDPILGARFYGFGNELKSGLAVLVLGAVAAGLYPALLPRPAAGGSSDPAARAHRRAAFAMAGAGIVLAIAEGSARIGAGVGGVILVGAGTAVATVMLMGGRPTRRRALVVLISPLAGLLVLAAIDLATAHGSGHFTDSVLHARSAGDVRDIIVRRYTAAWQELKNHAMPFATALALLYAAHGVRLRARLLAPVDGDQVWLAALCGGLAAGVVGAFSEDSGPVLLVVAVFALGCLLAYIAGRPRSRDGAGPGASPRKIARRPGTWVSSSTR